MTSVALERREEFGIGRVLGNAFGVIGRNRSLLVGLAAMFSAVPAFVLNLWTYKDFANIDFAAEAETIVEADPATIIRDSLITIALGLTYFVLALLFQSTLVRATIEDLNGKRPAIGDCIQMALRCILPTLGIGIVVCFVIFLGFMAMFAVGAVIPIFGPIVAFLALLIPGVRWLLGLSVSVPVLIQERLGVFGSISRSRALTKGSRWLILGLLLILFMVAFGLQFVFVLLLGLGAAFAGKLSTVGLIISSIGSAAVSTVVSTLISVTIAVTYVELRRVKEGTGVDELAEIFS